MPGNIPKYPENNEQEMEDKQEMEVELKLMVEYYSNQVGACGSRNQGTEIWGKCLARGGK